MGHNAAKYTSGMTLLGFTVLLLKGIQVVQQSLQEG